MEKTINGKLLVIPLSSGLRVLLPNSWKVLRNTCHKMLWVRQLFQLPFCVFQQAS
jgi:hypothetical protein